MKWGILFLVLTACTTQCKPWASLAIPDGVDSNDTKAVEDALSKENGGIPPWVAGFKCKY